MAAGLTIALAAGDLTRDGWQGLLTLCFVAIAFERVGIRIYGDTHVSAGVVALFAIAILYGSAGAAVAAPAVVLCATILTPSRWHSRIFDMGSYTLANVAAAAIFHRLVDVDAGLSAWWVPAGVVAIVVNYSVNAWLVAMLASFYSGEYWLTVWRQEHQWIFPYYIVFGLLGLALAAAYLALEVPGILAFVAPPLMMRFALHQYVTKTEATVLELRQKNTKLEEANRSILQMTDQLTETYDGTLEALVLALDARDRETKGHSLRVANYVKAIAAQMGVVETPQELVDMQRGALLHDVGKIGVPDFILHKPGPLTPEEWDDMKRHPAIGHGMLRDISFLSGAAAVVHAHHERFDGKGYPRGLAGDEIPLGARIFAVADAFDAMTSDRPYRKALPPEMAREEIVRHSGTQFDPQVVQAFLYVYDWMAATALEAREEEHARAAA
jgi:putative nucleotidyltransferase with HDIG domain